MTVSTNTTTALSSTGGAPNKYITDRVSLRKKSTVWAIFFASTMVATHAQPVFDDSVPDGVRGPLADQPLPQATHGKKALRDLGERISKVAVYYSKSAERMQSLFQHEEDLWINTEGQLFYSDSIIPRAPHPEAAHELLTVEAILPLEDTFKLHNRPTALRKIYLDFDGHHTVGTSWNSGIADIYTPPFDLDGDPSTFSAVELERVQKIWQRVVEDYSPFDVDVTTEDPGVNALIRSNGADLNYGVRVCIGGDFSDWYGGPAGGVAFIGSFHWKSDTPCFVFAKTLFNNEKYVAEATSHEIGHTVDLNHDGTSTQEYYEGHGSGATSWAPIMGVGYYASVVQFSKGEYADANNRQDDLEVMSRRENIPFRADDFPKRGIELNAGTFDVSGIVSEDDADTVLINAPAGDWALSVAVDSLSPNLYARVELYQVVKPASQRLIATLDNLDVLPTFVHVIGQPPGRYILLIRGQGALDPATSGFSSYGSIGQYRVSVVSPAFSSIQSQ